MPEATTYQCPNCGGVASFHAAAGEVVCASCGAAFGEGQLDASIPLDGAPLGASPTEHVRTVEGFLARAPWEDAHGGMANAVEYSCPACSACVVADQSTVATSCPYCGNNLIVQGVATPENIPEAVMPFTVSREGAQRALAGQPSCVGEVGAGRRGRRRWERLRPGRHD